MPNITKRFVDSAEPGRYYDDRLTGFGLRVGDTGTRSYFIEYRAGRGRGAPKRRLTLGRHGHLTVEQARKAAQEQLGRVAAGEDPATRRKAVALAQSQRFETIVAEWLKRDQAANRSHNEVKRLMERDVLPVLAGRPIEEIRKRDIIALVDAIADRGAPIVANRVLAHTKRLFKWAAGRDIIESDPAAHVEKASPEVSRDRVLSDDELVAVWRAAEGIEGPFGAGVRLLIMTGARREEIFSARWSELSKSGDALALPRERAKSNEQRVIWLSPRASDIVEGLPRLGPFMLTTIGDRPFSNISKNKARLDELSGVTGWRLHDIRRTVATSMQRLGVRLEVIEAVLGHVSGSRRGIVRTYQRHTFENEAREALAAWGAHVDALISGRASAEVVPLRRA